MVSLTLTGQGLYRGTFPEISNRADWITEIEIVNDDTETTIDISTATFIVELQDVGFAQKLLATTANGKVTLPATGIFRFTFTAEEMAELPEGNYHIGIRMTLDSVRYQLFVAEVPIVEGHIT